MIKQIPNFFTLLNLVFGCMAIICTLQNGIAIMYTAESAQFIDIPERIWQASLFIGLAAIVDFLDGFVARLFKASSEMGKQLDSLADLVSFGVAPSVIMYQFLRMSFAKDAAGIDASWWVLLPAILIAVAAAYRLARFNLDTSQQYGFRGVPVPAIGLLIASFPLMYWNFSQAWVVDLLLNKYFLYAFILIVCWLMVSTIPMLALKFKNLSVKENMFKYILIAGAVVAGVLLKWAAVPVVFILYIILSLAAPAPLQHATVAESKDLV